MTERSAYEICPVCFWEDDGQDDHDADHVRGGPNGTLSLTAARANFQVLGACNERCTQYAAPPPPAELPEIIKSLTRENGIPVIRAGHEAATYDPVTGRRIDTAAEYSNGP